MKLKHRCTVLGCSKCGSVIYGNKHYLCKKHNPKNIFKEEKDSTSIYYDLKNGDELVIIK